MSTVFLWPLRASIFNRSYIASAFLNPDGVAGQPVAFEPGLPRNVVVGMTIGGK